MPGAAGAALDGLVDFFYPQACVSCGCAIEEHSGFLCRQCLGKIVPAVGDDNCPRCGMPAERELEGCLFCARLDTNLEKAFSAAWFAGPVPDMLHLLKYRGMHRLAVTMAEIMAASDAARDTVEQADIMIPVPLFFWRKLRRGFNQSEKIAEALAGICSKEQVTGALSRIRNTRTQTRLSVDERRINVDGAFRVVAPELVFGKSVCLIDDVMTTGATVSACASALKQNGARRVTAYSFARA